MPCYVYIAESLDGYIAKKDGDINWLNEIPNPDKSDFGFAEFMEEIDAVVMGRKTFEKVLSFGEWPYTKPVFVLSNSKTKIPDELVDKCEFVKGELKEIVKNLNEHNLKHLYIDGGLTIQGFLNEDLIDEMIITRIPILLGEGINLFGELKKEMKFKHSYTKIYNDNLVKTSYLRTK